MAVITFATGKNVRIYKDGAYIATSTGETITSTQNVVEKNFIGDNDTYVISTSKLFEGSLTHDMTDDSFMEAVVGRLVATRFTATNYIDFPDAVHGTVDASTDVDVSFTTPNKTGLKIQKITFNGLMTGRFEGGLDIEIWEGAAGSGTLKTTFHLDEGYLPSVRHQFVDAYLDPESDEVALTANTAHTIRFSDFGAPTGSFALYKPTGATAPYYAIVYEMTETREADYVIDTVFADDTGASILTIRDSGITLLGNNVTINPSELISEVTNWKASSRTIV